MGPVGTKWYPATIARVGDDGEYDLAYDDGDFEERVQVRYVKYAKLQPRPPTPPTPPTPPVKEEEEIAVQEASPTEEALPTEAEGYKLHMSTKSSTGYKGVSFANYNGVGRYKAHHANLYLNSFETAVEAAVCYAKAVKKGKCEGVVEKVADAGTEAVALSVARSACAAALVVEEQGSKGMFGRGNSRKRVSTLDAKIMWEEMRLQGKSPSMIEGYGIAVWESKQTILERVKRFGTAGMAAASALTSTFEAGQKAMGAAKQAQEKLLG